MRNLLLSLWIPAVLLAATPLYAATPKPAKPARETAVAQRYLQQGEELLKRAEKATKPARQLAFAERALTRLHRARAMQQLGIAAPSKQLAERVETALIRALNLKTRVHLERKSLERAKLLNQAALSYARTDIEALRLRSSIARAQSSDLYESVDNRVGIERVRERRSNAGSPVRDRGLSRRR